MENRQVDINRKQISRHKQKTDKQTEIENRQADRNRKQTR